MRTSKDKISVKQLLFVFTIIVSSPATRFLPKYAAAKAAQAGWVSPVVCIVPFIALIFVIDSILKKYKDQSMAEIITTIMGRYLGKLVLVLYLLWVVLLLTLYTRYYAERLTSSIYPNINNNVLIILTLIPIAYMLRSGFTVIARMSEILLPFVGAMLVMLSIFLLPKIRTDNILPVYFNDIVPIVKASFASTGILSYLFLLFFLSDKIVNMKSFKAFGYIATYINISSLILVMFITIGVLGVSVARRAPLPVLITVKQASLMDTIENIEAIIIAIWIFTDFTLISTFFVVTLNLIKSIFKLSDTRPLINILAILIYFLSMGISSTKFELEEFSNTLFIPLSMLLGYGFPIVLLVLSKLKKGVKSNTK
ncbi:MAG: hypothetical protein APF77_13175 [Clostridia bacterium BRH_c25]|nr:MAG: hypothetical protein APF77_13175 [Clostridia bacterium BRH_c25]